MGAERGAALPPSLVAARALMFAVAALSVLWSVSFLAGFGVTAENVGNAAVILVPGAGAFLLGRRMRGGDLRLRRWIIGLQLVWIFFALGRLGEGDPSGVLGFIIPIAVLVLVTRDAARCYLAEN